MSVFYWTKRYIYVIIFSTHSFFCIGYISPTFFESIVILVIFVIQVILIIDDTNMFCCIMLMYGGQNMFRRPRNLTDSGNQQHITINDSQSLLIYSLMDRVLKQGDAIVQMEATLVGIRLL